MIWLALVIGNSRFHWGAFEADRLLQRWDTPHFSTSQLQKLQEHRFAIQIWPTLSCSCLPDLFPADLGTPELWVASVVKPVLAGLATYPALTLVERQSLPINGLYKTFGVDRALNLLGAGVKYGWPVLVVDCGTALTYTAGDQGTLIGGAILPGLRLQLRALHDYTDQLPWIDHRGLAWPVRWARSTEGAIASGVLHTHLAGIRDFVADWWQGYPSGNVIFTGGDGETIAKYLAEQSPSMQRSVQTDPNLVFWGLRAYRQDQLKDR